MNLRDIAITSTLALSGAALWSHGASRLAEGGHFDYRPNPLGLKQSPYGQVIAIAMQGSVESDWHGATDSHSAARDCAACGQHHGSGNCGETTTPDAGSRPARGFIERLDQAVSERTNPRPATEGHKFYLRRQAEERLRFAWSLDPSNYANYHAYHLFLSESSIGTKEARTDGWIEHGIGVARSTIGYCLKESHDPRPALTAAVAAANALELMLFQKDSRPVAELREMLSAFDHALARHVELSNAWVESGTWANLSALRQQEIADRYSFLLKIRDANAAAIDRIADFAPPDSRDTVRLVH